MNELKWVIFSLILFVSLLLLLIFTKITVSLNYYHKKDDDDLKIEFRAFFGLIRYKKSFPLIKIDDQSPAIVMKGETEIGNQETTVEEGESKITPEKVLNSFRNYKELLERVFQLHIIIRKFLNRVSVTQFEWQSVIGVGDASYTGMVVGALWAIKGSIFGLLSQYLTVKERPKLMVQPNFHQMITQTKLKCMFQFRIGYAILAGIKLVKFWKDGHPQFKSNTLMSNEESKTV